MRKITIKLKQADLQTIMHDLQSVIAQPKAYGYSNEDSDRLFLACLTELFYKLHSVADPFYSQYKLKLSVSQSLAFYMHFMALPADTPLISDWVIINSIIATIQKYLPNTPDNGETNQTDQGNRRLAP